MSDRYASQENRCMLDAIEERMPTGEERIERACMERTSLPWSTPRAPPESAPSPRSWIESPITPPTLVEYHRMAYSNYRHARGLVGRAYCLFV